MEKTYLVLTALAIIVFSGCTASGPKFSGFKKPSTGEADVYIYRKWSLAGSGLTPEIHKKEITSGNDSILGNVKPNGYILTSVKPNNYEFWASTEVKNGVIIDVKEKKIYCIEHYVSIGFLIGHPQFKTVNLAQCAEEIKNTRLSK